MAKFPVLLNLHGIYTLLRGRIQVKMCYFPLPFLGDPSWYILSQAVAIENEICLKVDQFDGHFKLISQHIGKIDNIHHFRESSLFY